jgi:hypothetical protein
MALLEKLIKVEIEGPRVGTKSLRLARNQVRVLNSLMRPPPLEVFGSAERLIELRWVDDLLEVYRASAQPEKHREFKEQPAAENGGDRGRATLVSHDRAR